MVSRRRREDQLSLTESKGGGECRKFTAAEDIKNNENIKRLSWDSPRSPWGLCGSVAKASKPGIRRSEVRFLMRTQDFFFVPRSWQDEKKFFSIPLPSSKLTISLISIYKQYTIDIADPSNILDACHTNFVINLSLTVESLWLSGRASERGIRRSEVRFLMGTQNFFSVPRSWQDEQKSFSTLLFLSRFSK